MFKKLFSTIKIIAKQIYDAPGLNYLFTNAYKGWPNSQYDLAKYYLLEKSDYLEAYAWADVAYCRGIPQANAIKQEARYKLKPEQIKLAWEKASQYRKIYLKTSH